MEKKIAALKDAYAAKDWHKLVKIARSVVEHDCKHPFCSCLPHIAEVVKLAQKICDANPA